MSSFCVFQMFDKIVSVNFVSRNKGKRNQQRDGDAFPPLFLIQALSFKCAHNSLILTSCNLRQDFVKKWLSKGIDAVNRITSTLLSTGPATLHPLFTKASPNLYSAPLNKENSDVGSMDSGNINSAHSKEHTASSHSTQVLIPMISPHTHRRIHGTPSITTQRSQHVRNRRHRRRNPHFLILTPTSPAQHIQNLR